MARGYYYRHPRDAAVTKLIAKPMLSVFFPELTNVEQPLSGEVCASTKAWKALLNQRRPLMAGVLMYVLDCSSNV